MLWERSSLNPEDSVYSNTFEMLDWPRSVHVLNVWRCRRDVMSQESLSKLMTILRNTHPSFVRCIIPNEQKKAGIDRRLLTIVITRACCMQTSCGRSQRRFHWGPRTRLSTGNFYRRWNRVATYSTYCYANIAGYCRQKKSAEKS